MMAKPDQSSDDLPQLQKKLNSIRTLISQSPHLTAIPSNYVFYADSNTSLASSEPDIPLPVIDFAFLTSNCSTQRFQVIHQLGQACHNWGFFMVINHGVSEDLVQRVIESCGEFFNMEEKDKVEFQGESVLDGIRFGTSFNAAVDKVLCWKDYLKVLVHPQFNSPHTPASFREIAFDYCTKTRNVARKLLQAISESLGLEPMYMDKALDLDKGLQVLAANYYPPCPQPDLAMGMTPHSDHGLLTLLVQNNIGGLQLQHGGKWVNVDAIPGAFLVNIGDHLEILSNGRYKSVLHRAVVNNKSTRISIAMAHGPSLNAIVRPAAELLDDETNPAAYIGMRYKDYLQQQQSNPLDGKSGLDRVKIGVRPR
ncbi:hypothetical protein QQ045_003265 [Rhodiola kirilowii]